MKKVAVFGSGNGSNFEAIVRHFKDKPVEFLCVSDKKDSYILERAKNHGIKSFHLPFKETVDFLRQNEFDLVVLAGYMRILPADAINLARMINVHPSLLPSFKGINAIKQAYDYGVKFTGITVHYVCEEVDAGEIIAQSTVKVKTGMTLEELELEIHKAEHELYPKVIEEVLFGNNSK